MLSQMVLIFTLGYNSPVSLPWEWSGNYNKPDQFHNVLASVTAENNSGQFFKYAYISGNDSHNGKYIAGNWVRDNSKTPDKNYFAVGQSFYLWNMRAGIGYGYLDKPDNIRLSGHWQFNISLAYQWNNVLLGLEHYSNGSNFFNGSNQLNRGIDFFTIGYKF